MPSSSATMRDALSKSMANIDYQADYQAEPGSGRRARQTPNKKTSDAMRKSCSAFHFILEADDDKNNNTNNSKDSTKKVGLEKKHSRSSRVRTNNNSSTSPNTGASPSASAASAGKPSYSDLIMDATAKTQSTIDSESPTSVASIEGDSGNAVIVNGESTGETKLEKKPSRSIPSSNAISRRQIMSSKSMANNNHNSNKNNSSNNEAVVRERRKKRGNNNRGGGAMHMSMQDFPDPADFQRRRGIVDSPAAATTTKPITTARNITRFSKSFSGMDDWDPSEFTASLGAANTANSKSPASRKDAIAALTGTPSRRGGKKPMGLPKCKRDTQSSAAAVENTNGSGEINGFEENTIEESFFSEEGNNTNNNVDDDNNNSLTEMDLLKGLSPSSEGNNKAGRRKKSPKSRKQHFSKSLSSFGTPQDFSMMSEEAKEQPNHKKRIPRRRRSSVDRELNISSLNSNSNSNSNDNDNDNDNQEANSATKVETEKVSDVEFNDVLAAAAANIQKGDESKDDIDIPTITRQASRDKREKALTRTRFKGGRSSSRTDIHSSEAGPRIRRTKSHDGTARPIRADGAALRRPRSNKDPIKRSTSRSPKTSISDSTPPQEPEKRTPRVRRKSSNPSGSVERTEVARHRRLSTPLLENPKVEGAQDSPPARKPRQRRAQQHGRTKSVDMTQQRCDSPSPMHASSRRDGLRRTMSSDGCILRKSARRLRIAAEAATREASLVRSTSQGGERVAATNVRRSPARPLSNDENAAAGGDLCPTSATRGGKKPSVSRQKVSNRSKSHEEGNGALVKRSSRDRESSSDGKEKRPHRRRVSCSTPTTPTDEQKVVSSAAERRAQAHAILG